MTAAGIAVTIDFSDVMKHAAQMKHYADDLFPKALEGAVEEMSYFFEREAKMNAPVDSGRLRASIGHGPDGVWKEGGTAGKGYWIDVGTNVEYAPYMEFGFTMSSGHVVYIKAVGGFRYVHPFTFEGYHYMQKAGSTTRRMVRPTVEKHLQMAQARAGLV